MSRAKRRTKRYHFTWNESHSATVVAEDEGTAEDLAMDLSGGWPETLRSLTDLEMFIVSAKDYKLTEIHKRFDCPTYKVAIEAYLQESGKEELEEEE